MSTNAKILDFVEFRRLRRPEKPVAVPLAPVPRPAMVWVPVWVVIPVPTTWRPA
jgi:hypothetical protein